MCWTIPMCSPGGAIWRITRSADEIVDRVQERVLNGMGLIVLHSGHLSKIFPPLDGHRLHASKWREADEKERIWVVDPSHPICDGLPEYIEIDEAEMYGEHFRYPGAGYARLYQLVRRWRGLPQRLLLSAGARQDLLFPPGARDLSDLIICRWCTKVIANGINWASAGFEQFARWSAATSRNSCLNRDR